MGVWGDEDVEGFREGRGAKEAKEYKQSAGSHDIEGTEGIEQRERYSLLLFSSLFKSNE